MLEGGEGLTASPTISPRRSGCLGSAISALDHRLPFLQQARLDLCHDTIHHSTPAMSAHKSALSTMANQKPLIGCALSQAATNRLRLAPEKVEALIKDPTEGSADVAGGDDAAGRHQSAHHA